MKVLVNDNILQYLVDNEFDTLTEFFGLTWTKIDGIYTLYKDGVVDQSFFRSSVDSYFKRCAQDTPLFIDLEPTGSQHALNRSRLLKMFVEQEFDALMMLYDLSVEHVEPMTETGDFHFVIRAKENCVFYNLIGRKHRWLNRHVHDIAWGVAVWLQPLPCIERRKMNKNDYIDYIIEQLPVTDHLLHDMSVVTNLGKKNLCPYYVIDIRSGKPIDGLLYKYERLKVVDAVFEDDQYHETLSGADRTQLLMTVLAYAFKTLDLIAYYCAAEKDEQRAKQRIDHVINDLSHLAIGVTSV